MFNKLIKELFETKLWQIDPSVGGGLARQIVDNMMNHSPYGETSQKTPVELLVCRASERRKFMSDHAIELVSDPLLSKRASLFQKVMVGNAPSMMRWGDVAEDDEVINLMHIDGPITRSGGACSIGSQEVRDQLISLSNKPQVLGHIFTIDSPGGSSYSSNDFEMGIAAAKEAGQPTIGLIDGTCASAAKHFSALLDEVYYVHPKCQIGCIGTYGAFFTNKNGDQNTVNQEVYHEIYASQSTEKNLMFRLSANGDDSAIQKMVDEDAEEFMQDIRDLEPNTPEEWLTGVMVDCDKTEGIWTVGRSNLDGCIQRVLELSQKGATTIQ